MYFADSKSTMLEYVLENIRVIIYESLWPTWFLSLVFILNVILALFIMRVSLKDSEYLLERRYPLIATLYGLILSFVSLIGEHMVHGTNQLCSIAYVWSVEHDLFD